MKKALELINELKQSGLIRDYAIAGGIATIYYTEPYSTYDLDIFVALAGQGSGLLDLTPVYDFIRARGYRWKGEHLVIGGFPVHILAGGALEQEAIGHATSVEYEGVKTRVMTPEHLIAIFTAVSRPKDKLRVLMLIDKVDRRKLNAILRRYGLNDQFEAIIEG